MVALLLLLLMASAPLASAADQAPDLFIEAVLHPPTAYVQSQVRYRVRLYRSSVFQQGDFVTPEIPDLVTRLVAEDEPVEVQRGGRTYQMIERRYLLYPQKSGILSLPGAVFSGRQVFARGRSLDLEVRPAVAPGASWLPATGLTLREVWNLPEPPWHVGAHLERRVSVEARGLTGAQIPALGLSDVQGLRHQRTRVQVDERLEGFGVVGRRVEHLVYVPTRAGSLRLPGFQLSWWDLKTDTGRIAQLPGRSFRIGAAADSVEAEGAPPISSMSGPAAQVGSTGTGTGAGAFGRWFAVVAGTLLVGVLSWRFALRGISNRLRRRRILGLCLKRLQAACLSDDPRAAGHALLDWGRARWEDGQPLTLGRLAARLDDPGAAADVWRLDAAIYSRQSPPWDPEQSLRRLRKALRSRAKTRAAGPLTRLPPLN